MYMFFFECDKFQVQIWKVRYSGPVFPPDDVIKQCGSPPSQMNSLRKPRVLMVEGEREVRVRKVKFTHSCASGNLLSRSADHEKRLRPSWVGSRIILCKHRLARSPRDRQNNVRGNAERMYDGYCPAQEITITALSICGISSRREK